MSSDAAITVVGTAAAVALERAIIRGAVARTAVIEILRKFEIWLFISYMLVRSKAALKLRNGVVKAASLL